MKAFVSVFLFSLLSHAAHSNVMSKARSFDLSRHDSNVTFRVTGASSLIDIEGTGAKLNGNIKITGTSVEGEFLVPLSSISTGNELRDEHIKSYLEVAKFPYAILKISNLQLENKVLQEKVTQKGTPFKGKLFLHGQESEVSGTADINATEKVISVKARTKTLAANYKMDLGAKVVDEIAINVGFDIKKD